MRGLAVALALIAGWGVYTVGAFPVLERVTSLAGGEISGEAAGAKTRPSPPASAERPALNACFYLPDWSPDKNCTRWGGYAAVWSELCYQSAACHERVMTHQQRCVDRPASCFHFLSERKRPKE